MFRKKYIWPFFYSILLISFTAYVLLDTFVLTRVYTVVSSENNPAVCEDASNHTDQNTLHENQNQPEQSGSELSDTASIPLSEEAQIPAITENSYRDENITIFLTEYREYDTAIYVADVRLSASEYLKTALAQDSFGKNITEKTSLIAEAHEAILAINGDYYGAQEKGYVLRNGTIYRSTVSKNQEDLVILGDGTFTIITEGEVSTEELLADGAQQILSFGPALLIDSSISVTKDEEVGKAKTSNPRTAIGIVDDLHYLFVVSDGRTEESEGLTLYELEEFMQSLGASVAYNLDGGGSSTMYFNGQVINNPTTSGRSIKERSVSDIVYIGY